MTRLAARFVLPLLVAAAIQPAGAQQLTPTERATIHSTLDSLFALDLAPGMGIVVVRDTAVVYLKGLGVRLGYRRPDGGRR